MIDRLRLNDKGFVPYFGERLCLRRDLYFEASFHSDLDTFAPQKVQDIQEHMESNRLSDICGSLYVFC